MKLNIEEIKTVQTDLSNLSNAVDKDVAEKTIYDELAQKVNAIDSDKLNLQKKIEDIDKKILDNSKFVETQAFNRLRKKKLM